MKLQNIFEMIYKAIMLLAFVYVGYELNSIKKLALENEKEINYVTSKLDYVTSDINITKVND
ncbi:MAG: hypothetical protein ACKVOU_01620 [Cytophagales bacterium]